MSLLLLGVGVVVHLPTAVLSLSSPSNPKTSKLKKMGIGSGGRVASKPSMPNIKNEDDKQETDERWEPTPLNPSEARLTVVQITDVYTLEHFASLKTMLADTREKITNHREKAGAKEFPKSSNPKQTLTESETGVISMLTGDFLAPYLLSSVDRGKGMMRALRETPIDYLTWVSLASGCL